VRNFVNLLPADRLSELMDGVAVASIGPITSDTAADLGLAIDIEAEEYTIPGLCQAMVDHWAG
jgi:uroporphyrinogen III methyltransferase/synthase